MHEFPCSIQKRIYFIAFVVVPSFRAAGDTHELNDSTN